MALTDDEALDLNRRVEATFGDDGTANTDKRLQTAVHGFYGKWDSVIGEVRKGLTNYTKCPNCGIELGIIHLHGIDRFICKEHGLFGIPGSPVKDDGLTFQQWSWDNRNGQPWQADIERHVSEWRADPRDFARDDALAMTLYRKLMEQGPRVELQSWISHTGLTCHVCRVYDIGEGTEKHGGIVDTIAEAVCRAWLAVAEEGCDGE